MVILLFDIDSFRSYDILFPRDVLQLTTLLLFPPPSFFLHLYCLTLTLFISSVRLLLLLLLLIITRSFLGRGHI